MKKTLSIFYILLAGSLWGSMGIFVRKMNEAGLFAFEIIQVRITLSLLFTGLYLLIFHPQHLKIRLRDLWCFLGTGIASQLAFSWFDFTGMTITSLSVMSVLLSTAPIFVMLLSVLLFKERLTKRKLFCLVLTFLGCCLVAGIGTAEQAPAKGIVYGLCAGIAYALYSIFSRFAIQKGYSALTINFYTYLTCSIGCAFLTDWPLIGERASEDASILFWMLAMALFTCFFAFLLYTKGLEQIESSRAAILASVEPVVSTIIGAAVFHEQITILSGLGVALVLAGIALSALQAAPSTAPGTLSDQLQ